MSKNLLNSKDAVSAVSLEKQRIAKEEKILGRTINKFGRLVFVTRKKYGHMQKCGDLLADADGNKSRFVKLNDEEFKCLKAWTMRQNQVVCSETPEDMGELETDVKALLKEDAKQAKLDRADFNEAQAKIKAKKAGNITVVAPTAPVDNGEKAKLDAREAKLAEREKAIEAKENEAKNSAPVTNTATQAK